MSPLDLTGWDFGAQPDYRAPAADIHHGDCLKVLAGLPADSIDSCVTDPPYHLLSIVKRFGAATAAPAQYGTDGAYARASKGFMGRTWDGGDIAMRPPTWAAVARALKPGAHLAVFGGTRTYHRMACAMEDAGLEIRDCLMWMYGQGFPKSHNISKHIDRMAGAERDVIGRRPDSIISNAWRASEGRSDRPESMLNITAPATEAAKVWDGWGTALKPAWEPILLARKPLAGTIAANVLTFGTGGLNIDGCRVPVTEPRPWRESAVPLSGKGSFVFGSYAKEGSRAVEDTSLGRWPANVLHDGSGDVLHAFAEFGEKTIGEITRNGRYDGTHVQRDPDSRSAARFFYCAKASAADRAGSSHPTVKPIALLRYLCRLITPPGGTILDPFAGSGTLGQAAAEEGFQARLIEAEGEYIADIVRRLGAA